MVRTFTVFPSLCQKIPLAMRERSPASIALSPSSSPRSAGTTRRALSAGLTSTFRGLVRGRQRVLTPTADKNTLAGNSSPCCTPCPVACTFLAHGHTGVLCSVGCKTENAARTALAGNRSLQHCAELLLASAQSRRLAPPPRPPSSLSPPPRWRRKRARRLRPRQSAPADGSPLSPNDVSPKTI